MCEAHAFILKDGTEEQILESVDEVEVIGDEVRLVNIFGEQIPIFTPINWIQLAGKPGLCIHR